MLLTGPSWDRRGTFPFQTQVSILWINDRWLAVCGDRAGGSASNHDAGHASRISQLVVSSESSNFPRLGLWSLVLGDRHAFFDLVEADVASSARGVGSGQL